MGPSCAPTPLGSLEKGAPNYSFKLCSSRHHSWNSAICQKYGLRLVIINSQMHSWLTSDGRSHHCILSCPLKYSFGREERTKVSFLRGHLLTVSTTSWGKQPGRLLLHGCQQGWYLLYLPLPSDTRHLRGAVSSINASFHGCVYLQNGSRCLLTWISVYWIYTLCLDQRNIKLIFIDRMCQVQIKLRIF